MVQQSIVFLMQVSSFVACGAKIKMHGSQCQKEFSNEVFQHLKESMHSKENQTIFAALSYQGPVAQLNRVSDYGSEGSRFESWRGH